MVGLPAQRLPVGILGSISGLVLPPLPLVRCVAADRGLPPTSEDAVMDFPSSDTKNVDASP